jgi:hypothetical protein
MEKGNFEAKPEAKKHDQFRRPVPEAMKGSKSGERFAGLSGTECLTHTKGSGSIMSSIDFLPAPAEN